MTYIDIVNSFLKRPRDVHTVPIRRNKELWFYVFEENGIVYVKSALEHKPSSNITKQRRLDPEHFDSMIEIYRRRCCGDKVSQEAGKITMCQVYWYGIFAELGI